MIARVSRRIIRISTSCIPAAVIAGPMEAEARTDSRIPERPGRARGVRRSAVSECLTHERETWAIARFTVLMAADRHRAGVAAGDRDRLAAGPPSSGQDAPRNAGVAAAGAAAGGAGLLLLWLFGRRSPVGRALDAIGIEVIFTWKAVVIAMMVISFPLVARSVRAGIEQVDRRFEHIAATLGAGPFRILRTITLPLASRGIVAGAILGFSRALGEFGATIMIAGAIPGRTQTLAVGIYTLVETGREEAAWSLLLVSALLAFGAIYASNRLVDQAGPRDRADDRRHAAAAGVRARRAGIRPRSRSWASSGHRAAARPRCSRPSPASARRTRARFVSVTRPVFVDAERRPSPAGASHRLRATRRVVVSASSMSEQKHPFMESAATPRRTCLTSLTQILRA